MIVLGTGEKTHKILTLDFINESRYVMLFENHELCNLNFSDLNLC